MNRALHQMTKLTSLFYLGLALLGKSLAAAPPQQIENAGAILQGPLSSNRSPASANPLLEASAPTDQRPGVPLLGPEPKPGPRWRLMGTCRQDTGMFRNQNGVGYGDCNN